MAQPTQVRNKWLVLFVVSFGTFMITLDGGIIGISYPALVSSFGSDPSTVLWVIVAYSLTSTGLLLTLGWTADVIGRRKIFALGFLAFTLGIALAPFSQTILQLIIIRVVQATGTSMIIANEYALITSAFPPGERGKAVGINISAVGLGLSVGPLMGGVLLDALDWRALFYTRVPIGLLGTGLAWFILPRDPRGSGQIKVDYLGAVALCGSLISFLLMVNQGGKLGFGSPIVLAMAGLTLVLFPVLFLVERRAIRPIVEFSLFKTRAYTLGLSVMVFHFMAQGSIRFLVPFYFITALGYSASKMGLFLSAFAIMRLFVAPLSGWFSDKLGYRLPASLGMMFFALGLFMFSRQGVPAAEWGIVLSLMIAGAGSALFDAPVISSIMSSVTPDRLGTASASVGTARNIAVSIGIALSGALFTIREKVYLADLSGQTMAHYTVEAQAVAWAFSDTLLAGAILALIGTAFTLAMRGKTQSRSDNQPSLK